MKFKLLDLLSLLDKLIRMVYMLLFGFSTVFILVILPLGKVNSDTDLSEFMTRLTPCLSFLQFKLIFENHSHKFDVNGLECRLSENYI